MPTDEQRKLIEEVLADRQEAIAAALIEEAETLVPVAVQSTLGELRRMVADKFTRQIVDGITKEQVAAYRAQVAKGGTDIIERVVTALGDGRASITTRRTFKPWLVDMATRDQEEILHIIGEGQRDGMHPYQIARELRGYFDGTAHNAVTIARTEAQKLRTDARITTYLKAGVHYLEYIAVGDERTRPDHAARGGKIYPTDKAPWLGEPNCRCILIDADYKVEEEGAPVEESDEVILDGIDATQPPAATRPVTIGEGEKVIPDAAGATRPPAAAKPVEIEDNRLTFFEQHGQSSVENSVVYDSRGRPIASTRGTATSCPLPDVDMTNTRFVHNHPVERVGLSSADVSIAIEQNLESMTSVTPSGKYMTISRPDNGWPALTRADIDRAYENAAARLRAAGIDDQYKTALHNGAMTLDEVNDIYATKMAKEALWSIGVRFKEAKL